MRTLIIGAEILGVLVMTLLIMRTSRTTVRASRPRDYRGRHRIARTPIRTRVRITLELSALSLLSHLPTPTVRSTVHA